MSKAKKRVTYVENVVQLDKEGNVNEWESTNVVQFPQEPPYVKMYIEDITAILKLPNGTKDLLYMLLKKMDYENIITLTSRAKKHIAETLNIKSQTIDNYLAKLVKCKILRRIGRGEYLVNANYFARGEWADVSRKRDSWVMTVTYHSNGEREIKGTLEK